MRGKAVDGGSMAIILFYTHTARWVVLPVTGSLPKCGDARQTRVAGPARAHRWEPVRRARRCPTHATTNDRRLHTASLAAMGMDSVAVATQAKAKAAAGLSGSWALQAGPRLPVKYSPTCRRSPG